MALEERRERRNLTVVHRVCIRLLSGMEKVDKEDLIMWHTQRIKRLWREDENRIQKRFRRRAFHKVRWRPGIAGIRSSACKDNSF